MTRAIYNQVDDLSGGSLSILTQAIRRFNDVHASEAAAGMAYYALFSLFPLLLVLIAVGSSVLESELVQQQLMAFITDTLPNSHELIKQNIQRVLELRGPVGVAGIVGLLWSASGSFNTLASNINRAWQQADSRGFLERRLVALGIVGSLAGLLILSVISTAVLDLLSQFGVPLRGSDFLYETRLWKVGSNLLPVLFRLLIFLGLYRWVPNKKVRWSEAFWGALVAALGWEVATTAFTWYLGSGLVRYELVYGSLGTIVGLMFWLYVISLIALFGAHISAAIARHG